MKLPICAFALLACSFLTLTSCETGPQPRRVPFNEADFAPYARSGSGSVVGQIYISFKDGSLRPGRSIGVDLVPVNDYTREIVERKIIHGENLAPGDPRYDKYVRHTVADDLGNFEFHHLPAGDYFVGGIVEWDDSQSFRVHQSQWAWERVIVQPGQSVRVVVNQ
jgi:hypothetical protein